jgi:hypothetical protein
LLQKDGGTFNCADAETMVNHVGEHVAEGHDVPSFVVPRLRAGQSFN